MLIDKFTFDIQAKFHWKILQKILKVIPCIVAIVSCQNQSQNADAYTNLIVNDRLAGTVLWSPVDSNKLLVSTAQGEFGKTEIYILDLESGEKQTLAKTEYGDIFAKTWSPDGGQVIIASLSGTKGFERGGLWIVGVNDTTISFLQDNSGDIIWGPTQDQLTFVRSGIVGINGVETHIVVKDLQTEQENIIYEVEENQEIAGLSWSPNKDKLAFVKRNVQPTGDFNVFILDMNSQELSPLTDFGDNTYSVWSPVQDQIVYRNRAYSGDAPVFSLHLTDSNRVCDVKLYEANTISSATWSPDGNSLAFVGLEGIYSIDVSKFLAENEQSILCH